jgi:hypothetical protein
MTDTKTTITGREARFAVFCKSTNSNDDLHLIKEVLHNSDGTLSPNIRLVQNFKRSFYVTKKGYRTHKQKKEWEELDKVTRFECTQSRLTDSIAKAIEEPWNKSELRKLCRSPFVYGSDILSTAVIKKSYIDKYPTLITPYTSAMFDIETDVLHGTEEILMATLSFKNRVVTVIRNDFVHKYSDVTNRLHVLMKKYLGEYIEKRKINWEIVFVDTESKVVTECFKRAHEWKPDFVAIWNIDFDLPKCIKALEKVGIEPKDVFSDPCVPYNYRHFRYKQGPKQKVTASGKVTPIKPPGQWHTVYCPSSFYFIDAMCVYKQIRTGNAEEPSYSLDAILHKHLGIRKLNFEQAEKYVKLEWHQFMQENYPLEYVIYNVFDCISMEELDEVTSDLALTLPLFSGCSDFENFKSQPRRLADTLNYFCLENNKVLGSTSDQMADELDRLTLSNEGWIITLPAHLVLDNGLRIIEENASQSTNIRTFVGDLDVSAAYPNNGSTFNISKATTHKELCKIQGVTEAVQRQQGLNLSGGHTNAVEFCTDLFKLPSMETLLKSFEEKVAS